ncbi:MAG: peptide transporter [Deltaproteobacteria bacterium]|nr:peptide transporter [Deltaproteobacteria bacterium]
MPIAALKNFLTLEQDRISLKQFFILIIIAYIFAVAVRFIWVYQFQDNPNIIWNNQIIINNSDGYYYAEGARDILAGGIHQENDGSPIHSFPSIFTAYLTKILPFNLETIILYLPAFLGSLLIIPILLIGRSIGQNMLGFIAALLGSITVSYYNRTMTGYYDTDMLTIVLPMFVIAALIHSLKHNKEINLLITGLTITIYQLWYTGGYSIICAIAGVLFFYTLIKEPKKAYNYKLITFMLIGIAGLPLLLKTGIYILLFSFLTYFKNRFDKYIIFILPAAGLMLLLFTKGVTPIIFNIKAYIMREKITPALTDNFSLNFFSVKQTIQEAKKIPFDIFAHRISGHTATFIISTIGYILMIIRYPVAALALPLAGLGFIALKGGLRFTIYTVPINALGFAYIASLAAKFTAAALKQTKHIKPAVLILITALSLYPNIIHIINYKKGPVVTTTEAAALEKLKKIAGREDYVISWWDYGYTIRYYSDTKTLGDGGRQNGDTNFPLSFILTENQIAAANMAKIAVRYNGIIADAMKDYNFADANRLLKALKTNGLTLPEKKEDIYLYLPFRIVRNQILPTIRAFCNLDIMTGRHYKMPLFYQTKQFIDNPDTIMMGNGFRFLKKTGKIKQMGKTLELNSLIITGYDKKGVFNKRIIEYNPMSDIYLIYMQSYGELFLMDKQVYNSLFIRLFVLEDYDKNLFEPVIIDPWTKIYRLKK